MVCAIPSYYKLNVLYMVFLERKLLNLRVRQHACIFFHFKPCYAQKFGSGLFMLSISLLDSYSSSWERI